MDFFPEDAMNYWDHRNIEKRWKDLGTMKRCIRHTQNGSETLKNDVKECDEAYKKNLSDIKKSKEGTGTKGLTKKRGRVKKRKMGKGKGDVSLTGINRVLGTFFP